MKKSILAMMAAGMLTACSNGSDTPDGPDTPELPELEKIEISSEEALVMEGEQQLAFELFDKVKANATAEQNSLISPISVHTVLSMIANGMNGQSRADICGFLNIQADRLDELNELNSRLVSYLPRLDKNTTIKSTNSIWAHSEAPVKDEFTSLIGAVYQGEIFQADFSTAEGREKFRNWVERQTDGMIANFKMPEDVKLAVANCISFEGKWADPFKKEATSDKNFRNGAGINQYVPTMKGYFRNGCKAEGFSAVRLPFGNGAYRMTLLLPENETKPLSETSLGYEQWHNIKTALDANRGPVNIELPRFKVNTESNLKDFFTAMKDTEAFSTTPDLSEMLASPNFFLKYFIHYTAIEINEESAKASSSSVGGIIASEPNVKEEIQFNRPFFYVIDEASTGAIIFIGALNKI